MEEEQEGVSKWMLWTRLLLLLPAFEKLLDAVPLRCKHKTRSYMCPEGQRLARRLQKRSRGVNSRCLKLLSCQLALLETLLAD